ncbi:hypothetical protein CLOSTASPAR_00671 [[Clostridium] asparagiforme DSM 15981]|uniref:Uncharacterized protein n=1 Tax=[Clostridium] asparagiforme DSM 15981 TaxID=518636 RepID=C0CUH9_9FIRM|nr:hypothetical protein CLOSTASPAR_00671 [[Clostridium] asparagiforme DSM 15981]
MRNYSLIYSRTARRQNERYDGSGRSRKYQYFQGNSFREVRSGTIKKDFPRPLLPRNGQVSLVI